MFHVTRITAALAAALLCLSFSVQAAIKSSKVDEPTIALKRGSSTVATFETMDQCRERKATLIATDGQARVSGTAVYDCITSERTRIAFGPNPPPAPACTAPKPDQQRRDQQCPTGTVGTWPQTLDHITAPYPACWSPGEWTPAEAPAGACPALPVARLEYSSSATGPYLPLDNATVTGPIAVRLTQCIDRPVEMRMDGQVVNVETLCPIALVGDDLLYDTQALSPGGHRLEARGAALTVTATFSVAADVAGSVPLSWVPPTQNTDDTPLTDLAGYKIIYGTSSAALDQVVAVPNPATTSYLIERLMPATWYFAVKAIDAAGNESVPSNIASKSLP